MQRSWGIPVPETALAAVVAGIWNNFVKLGLPIVALGPAGPQRQALAWRSFRRPSSASSYWSPRSRCSPCSCAANRWPHASAPRVAGSPSAARKAVRPPARRRLGRTGRRLPCRDRSDSCERGGSGSRSPRSSPICRCTWCSSWRLRPVGVSNDEVSWQEVLAAFSFVRLLSAVPITPGGLGVVELGPDRRAGIGPARRHEEPDRRRRTAVPRADVVRCRFRSAMAAGCSGARTRAGAARSTNARRGSAMRTRRSRTGPTCGSTVRSTRRRPAMFDRQRHAPRRSDWGCSRSARSWRW